MPPSLGVSAEAVGKCEATGAKQIRMISCMWPAPCCLSWPIVHSNIGNNKDAAEKNHIQLVSSPSSEKAVFLSSKEHLKPSVLEVLPWLSFPVCFIFDWTESLSA